MVDLFLLTVLTAQRFRVSCGRIRTTDCMNLKVIQQDSRLSPIDHSNPTFNYISIMYVYGCQIFKSPNRDILNIESSSFFFFWSSPVIFTFNIFFIYTCIYTILLGMIHVIHKSRYIKIKEIYLNYIKN